MKRTFIISLLILLGFNAYGMDKTSPEAAGGGASAGAGGGGAAAIRCAICLADLSETDLTTSFSKYYQCALQHDPIHISCTEELKNTQSKCPMCRAESLNDFSLYTAVRECNEERVNELLTIPGIDVNYRDESGTTPLMMAALSECLPIVNALITAGADINAHGMNGMTALIAAIHSNHLPIINALIAGADLEVTGDNGKTALMHAVMNNNLPLVNALIEAGANVNSHDINGEKILTFAAMNNNLPVINALMEAGATQESVMQALIAALVNDSNDAAERLFLEFNTNILENLISTYTQQGQGAIAAKIQQEIDKRAVQPGE